MLIDPNKYPCRCGEICRIKFRHRLLMLLTGKYIWTCHNCGTRFTFRLVHHVVKVDTDMISDKVKRGVFRNG